MQYPTKQQEFWKSDFGKAYTDRNTPMDFETWLSFYRIRYGIDRLEMFEAFLGHLPKDIKILEVGCNTGLQLVGLQKLGFNNLFGIELQAYAVEKSKSITNGINILHGSAFDLPFKDHYFDLVMTNGVLIHIAPQDIKLAMSEIYRCSKQFILGFEYYAEQLTEVEYRGNTGYLWKTNYSQDYVANFPSLKIQKEIKYPYLTENEIGNIDQMFLLEK